MARLSWLAADLFIADLFIARISVHSRLPPLFSPSPLPPMPELPEVETMRRGVAGIVGSRIERVEQPPCRLRPISIAPRLGRFAERLCGQEITAVGRRGKRLLIETEGDQTIVIEPRMTGLLSLADPPTPEHVRLRWHLRRCRRRVEPLWFWDRRGLGTVRLLRRSEVEPWFQQRLGPDALKIEPEQLRAALGSSRRAVKVALLDQRAVAGIGNLYAAEILFVAGVDPRARCDRLSGPQWRRIHRAIGAVLREAIHYEGSTLSDGTYRNALSDPGGYQHHHRVYDRAGRACGRCDSGTVRRIVQAQRSTFFCGVCQQKRGRHERVGGGETAGSHRSRSPMTA